MKNKPPIFCAIDTADLDFAKNIARQVGPLTGGLKLGLEFIHSFGPHGIDEVSEACPTAQIFIDLKFHDIPNTVAGAVRSVCSRFSPAYLNVHASGGAEMMQAAKAACTPETKLLGVTILTSLEDAHLSEIGYESGNAAQSVRTLALLTQKSGLDGVVCSAHEIKMLRDACGEDFVLMVPGIRLAGSKPTDQKRIMTPEQAFKAGASHLVIGRPITGVDDPVMAAQQILESLDD